MKAFVIDKHIKMEELSSKLRYDAPEPKAKGDFVVVDVYSAGLNFFDLLQVQGLYQLKPQHPYNAGCEFAGVITEVDPNGNSNFEVGTRVFGAGQGAYAEKILVDSRGLIPIPEGMSYNEAAGIYITFPTSYAALVLRGRVQPGETVLIHACAGGVGLSALLIAKALGAIVIATASTQEKLDVCKRFGADHLVNYSGDAKLWQDEVKKITKGKGVDVVYDPVGKINESLKVIAWNGRLVVVGFAGGNIEKVPTNLLLLKNVEVTGVHWGAYQKNQPEMAMQVWGELLEMFAEKKITSVVFDTVFHGLESVPAGLKALGSRGTWGKAVVQVKTHQTESKL